MYVSGRISEVGTGARRSRALEDRIGNLGFYSIGDGA